MFLGPNDPNIHLFPSVEKGLSGRLEGRGDTRVVRLSDVCVDVDPRSGRKWSDVSPSLSQSLRVPL